MPIGEFLSFAKGAMPVAFTAPGSFARARSSTHRPPHLFGAPLLLHRLRNHHPGAPLIGVVVVEVEWLAIRAQNAAPRERMAAGHMGRPHANRAGIFAEAVEGITVLAPGPW